MSYCGCSGRDGDCGLRSGVEVVEVVVLLVAFGIVAPFLILVALVVVVVKIRTNGVNYDDGDGNL